MTHEHLSRRNGVWIDALVPYADPGDVFPAMARSEFFARNPERQMANGADTWRDRTNDMIAAMDAGLIDPSDVAEYVDWRESREAVA